jgi:16S rRNA G527 N7-methylase RsmG
LGLWLGRTKRGLTLKELAATADLSNYRSVSTAIKHFERRMRHDKVIQRAAQQAATLMTYET